MKMEVGTMSRLAKVSCWARVPRYLVVELVYYFFILPIRRAETAPLSVRRLLSYPAKFLPSFKILLEWFDITFNVTDIENSLITGGGHFKALCQGYKDAFLV